MSVSRRYDGGLRASVMIGACLLGFIYGRHFSALTTNPALLTAAADTQRRLSAFVQQTSPPPRRGFQKKAGIVPELYWKKGLAGSRRLLFDSWLFRYVHHNIQTHPVVPYPSCQIYINHDYKFIWIKGHKVGGTALRQPLGWLCDDHWRAPEDADFQHCSQPLWLQDVTLEEALSYWKEYFVFGVVRNPYDRFASAYEYVKASDKSGDCAEKIGNMTFGEVCEDPYLHAVLCATGQCPCTGHHFRYFMPQAPCLLTESLLPATDFLADMDSLESDLAVILNVINERRNRTLPALEIRTSSTEELHAVRNLSARSLLEDELEVPDYLQELYATYPSCWDSVGYYFLQDFVLLDYGLLNA